MANKRYTNTIDSFGVDEHMLRVSGRVNVQQIDASEMPYDGEVLIVMLGRMTAPSYSETKDGDVIRVNVMKPIEVKVVKDIKTRRKIMESQNFEHEAQMVFTDMASGGETGPSASPITLLDVSRAPEPEEELDEDDDSIAFDAYGQSVPLVGEDDEYSDPVILGDDTPVDDGPIEEDFTIEGEPEPAVIEEPPVESEEETYTPDYADVDDEDEAAFLRQFMSQREPATVGAPAEEDEAPLGNETHRRVKIGGQADHDPFLRSFLES